MIPAYVKALCNEIRQVARSAPERLQVHTIFFGGGTPSLLTPVQFKKILQTIRASFIISRSDTPGSSNTSVPSDFFSTYDFSGSSSVSLTPEISLEANPGTVTPSSLEGLRKAGFNRISFGVQSFHTEELRLLERIHDPFDVFDAVRWARHAGFNNLNLDLIYGLPEQTLSRWQATLRRAIELNPEHLSLYALTIENGTPFGRWAARGRLPIPDPDLAADMYEAASETLAGQGYEQYEISNWSKPGFQCHHNLQYWRNLPYLGFGAGAHGCANHLRIANILRIKTYIEHFSLDYFSSTPLFSKLKFPLTSATATQTRLNPYIEMQETMMLGLRLTQAGVSPQAFFARFGQDPRAVFGSEIDELVGLELLEWAIPQNPEVFEKPPVGANISEVLRLTPRGRLLGNQVFMRFVG